ncbi:Fc.00g109100.m01.CDS01 [Cosmosporella sp. VM-42]
MPAIPIYRSSPIVAAKASGVTPQTAQPGDAPASGETPATTTALAGEQSSYPPAQPGARPSMPAPTGAGLPPSAYPAPTPTRKAADMSPPAPQPGAVPTPTGGKSYIPPPPKAGETLPPPMPPQMSYGPPTGSVVGPARSSTTTTAAQLLGSQPPTLPGDDNYSHPPGYHQNINASEFTSHQRAAHNAFVSQNPRRLSLSGDDGDEGVWDTAKKWAAAAGDSIAAAENEVWRRINKE